MTAVSIIIPVSICVVLPIAIVWIVSNTIALKNKRQSEIIMEAIKNNPNVDPEKLLEGFNKKKQKITPWRDLTRKLLRGSIFTLLGIAFALIASLSADDEAHVGSWMACGVCGSVGIGFLIAYFFGYKHIARLEAEQK